MLDLVAHRARTATERHHQEARHGPHHPAEPRADGTAAAHLRRAYDWMRRAGLTLHHRDAITPLASTPSVRVTRRVHDQYARPLEITDLVVDAQQDALVYEFTLPGRAPTPATAGASRRTRP